MLSSFFVDLCIHSERDSAYSISKPNHTPHSLFLNLIHKTAQKLCFSQFFKCNSNQSNTQGSVAGAGPFWKSVAIVHDMHLENVLTLTRQQNEACPALRMASTNNVLYSRELDPVLTVYSRCIIVLKIIKINRVNADHAHH